MVMIADDFTYKIGTDGDLWYTLTLTEFPLVNVEQTT
jgi:hypothetical protein